MLFGFLLVRTLLILVKGLSRLPDAVSRTFAAALNAATRPFHVVNYLCALPGGRVLSGPAMVKLMGRTIRQLRARLARESERTLALGMHFPIGWDPYFKDVMTVADVYDYPTKHYDHHRCQLTTRRASTAEPPPVPRGDRPDVSVMRSSSRARRSWPRSTPSPRNQEDDGQGRDENAIGEDTNKQPACKKRQRLSQRPS